MILLRVDDFPGTKPEEFDQHNLENFKRFDAVVTRWIPTYLLGVIPKHTTDEQWEWLATNKHVQVALHGINHDERTQNEFGAHLTKYDIYQAIAKAKASTEALVGREVNTYIPPHNSFDIKTVKALVQANFTSLHGGPGSPDIYGSLSAINYIDTRPPHQYGRSDELIERGSVEWFSRHDGWLTLHWTWEWNIGLNNLREYLWLLSGYLGKCQDRK